MCVPKLMLTTSGTVGLMPNAEFQFGLLYGAPVMLGWTILLFWADRKPLERKGILLCLIPVISAYILVEIFAILSGFIPIKKVIPIFIIQMIFISLCAVSYLHAQKNR